MNQINTIAITALQKHGGDVDHALPEFVVAVKAARLIDDLAKELLRTVAMRESGHLTSEAHGPCAGPTLSSSEVVSEETPIEDVPASEGSVTVKKHPVREHRRRTHAEKQAAMRAAATSIEAVFEMMVGGRRLGSIRFGELASMKRDLIDSASRGLMLHTLEVRDAIIAELIEQHCVAPDQLAEVSTGVDARTMEQFVHQAETEAPKRIAEAHFRGGVAHVSPSA